MNSEQQMEMDLLSSTSNNEAAQDDVATNSAFDKVEQENEILKFGKLPDEEGSESTQNDVTALCSREDSQHQLKRDEEELQEMKVENSTLQLQEQKQIAVKTGPSIKEENSIAKELNPMNNEVKPKFAAMETKPSLRLESEIEASIRPVSEQMDEGLSECDIKPNTSSQSGLPPFVVPLSSPRIPSLVYKVAATANAGNKEIKPTHPPPPKVEQSGDSAFKLMAYSKSISSALAKPLPTPLPPHPPVREKRKLSGGCSNVNCLSGSDELVIARKSAVLFFHFNTAIKKVYKICTPCYSEAENYMTRALGAAQNGDCVFRFKTEPQGLDGDVIEVKEGDEEDDPNDVRSIESEDKEVVELANNLDIVVGNILSKIDAKQQFEQCEKRAISDSDTLERDFISLDSRISSVEKQVIEAKKMYDKITGYNQPVPVILEQLDIDASGIIRRTKGNNPHIDKMSSRFRQAYLDNVWESKSNAVNVSQDTKRITDTDRLSALKENHPRFDDGEVMEIEPVQSKPPGRVALAPTPKVIPRVIPGVKSIVYALNRTLLHFWLKGEVFEVVNVGPGKSPEFIIRFEPTRRGHPVRDGKVEGTTRVTKQVTAKQIAYNIPCPFVLPVGARIIAKFRDELKTEPIGDGQFYAGVVAEPPKNTNNFRYLVFFDDGYAQYVTHRGVLMVYEASKEVWSDVHPDSSDFIKNYVQKYPERPMVRMTVGQIVTTEWNGKWWVARVVEIDCSLVKMKFENDGRCEWIYRGSTRLSPLFEKQTRQKRRPTARRMTSAHHHNQATIEYNYGDDDLKKPNSKPTARKSTGTQQYTARETNEIRRLPRIDYGEFEGSIIRKAVPDSAQKTKEYVPHDCSKSCVYELNESDRELRKLSPLALPLHFGWSRDIAKNPRRTIYYRGPCGKRLRDLEELYNYLTQTECDITIDHFCFDLAVDCLNEFRHARQHSFLPDLTYGREMSPVQVVNAFDFEYPPYVEYSSSRIPGAGVHLNTDDEFLVGCDCVDDCRDMSKCSCWKLTYSGISFTKLQTEEYPLQGYEYRRLKDHIVSGIYECNSKCKCSKTCCNRVVQNGLKTPLQVFKTAAKGWGIRPLFDIPEGSFICIYAGQVLTDQGANEDGMQFGDEYLAELDYIESNEGIKADYESEVTDIEAEDSHSEKSKKKRCKGKGGGGDDSEGEVDNHAGDSSYRGPKPTTERTIGTRNKNGKGSHSRYSNEDDSDNEDEDEGTRMRSRFNPDAETYTKSVMSKRERRPLREYFGQGEECYIMDAKTIGNIGRYLNHSCQPNVFVQNVFVDTHDLRFPWVAFFSSKHIRAGSELTWDYNYDIDSVPNKVLYCYCGSPECRGRLL